jgi:hypothetical protein
LVGPPTERGDPASLSNQPAAYLVDLRGSCIDFARQIFDACRHVGTQLANGVDAVVAWETELRDGSLQLAAPDLHRRHFVNRISSLE